jgi:glycine/D-amino acid oxidase-like deaminating enzyme
VDAIILGHGLAGATLAWHLRWLGWRVLVVDREESATSSKVAAGIVAPISGRRVARSWRVDEFLPVARAFYQRTAKELGTDYYRPTPYVRLLRTADEQRRWREKRDDPAFQRLLTSPQPYPLVDPAQFHDPGEGMEMQGAWLEVRAWLKASQQHLVDHGAWLTASVPPQAVTASASGAEIAVPSQIRARYLVFCQGWEAAANSYFPWLRWKSAKGEILTVSAPSLTEHRIVNGGGWLLPLGRDGIFRTGSTYAWDDFTSTPTAAARTEIESRLQRLLRIPFSVTGQEAGIRPVINESKAVIGLHPVHRRIAFFNGLGSKGVLHAPFFAAQLAALLVDGTPVEYEVDVCRN